MKKKTIIISVLILIVAGILAWLFIFKGPKTYTISFDTDGGSTVSSIKVEEGKTITLPVSTKENYVFDGWYDSDTLVTNDTKYTKDTNLKARWKEEQTTFKITFDSKGGSEVSAIDLECGKELVLPANPTKKGYTFGHWEDSNETPILNDALLSCEDITLYAKWNEEATKTFKVSFDSKGGNTVSDITLECGKTLKLPTNPTKSGSVFDHWEDKNGQTILDGALLSCNNVTLYAKWKNYTCPTGYELVDTNKCVEKVSVITKCKTGWTEYNNICVNPNSPNVKGTRTCPTKTYNGWTGTGTYYEAGRGYCGYQELTSYIGQKDNCKNNGGSLASNNHCYKHVEITYTTTCASDERMFASQELAPGNGGGCYQISQKEITCPQGYTINHTYGKCIKTVDATLK